MVFGGGHFITLRTVNVCLLEIAKGKIGAWLPFINGIFSTGALISPLLLKYMETNVFYIITTVFVVFGLLLLTFSTPIQKEK